VDRTETTSTNPSSTRRRPRFMLAALIGILALFLAACPEEDPEIVEEDDAPAVEDEVEDPGIALDERCTNEEAGYEVDHPADWDVFEGEELADCSAFDPDEVIFDLHAEVPLAAAIQIRATGDDLETVVEGLEERGYDVTSEEQFTVDGTPAVRVEAEVTEDGVFPAGTQLYEYYIERDEGTTIVATANDYREDEERDLDEFREVLDGMIASFEHVEIEADFEEEG
jgi:hypothetical protein